ncbi:hypothetical protein EF405_15860 [Cyclobacteriaceae bacterium YHN15]|nr:hypothetical protein EF405_15860 [Cyclobacteriaceae bacterium YHN15]
MKNFLSKIQFAVVLVTGTVLMNSCKVIEPFDPTPFAMDRQEIQTIGLNPSDMEKLKVSQQGSGEDRLNSEEGDFSTLPDSEKNK